MANRTLARHTDNIPEILEDGEPYNVGMWEEVTIERSAAGAPRLLFVITRYENDQMYDQMCVDVKDGAAFLAPVNAWLKGNEPRQRTEWEEKLIHLLSKANGTGWSAVKARADIEELMRRLEQ